MKTLARRDLLHRIHQHLLAAFGPQHWWPADTPFEVIVGAILTQNTAWRNVKKAIDVLRARGVLDFDALCAVPEGELALLIRSSGFYNQKARKLKDFCLHVQNQGDGGLAGYLSQDADWLRQDLLSIRGIGPETADSIVLYAAFKPAFVVDTYTHRVFSRHRWVAEETGYHELRSFFMDVLEPDVPFFQEYHALLVRTGHLYCRRTPACALCPLNTFFDET